MIDTNQVIHDTTATGATAVNFTAYTYTQVYAGSAASPIINGTTVTMAAGSSILILVKSISSTAGVYVIGRKRITPPLVING